MNYLTIKTPIGNLLLVENNNFLTNIYFENEFPISTPHQKSTPILQQAQTEILEYFDVKRRTFDVPINPKGGEFFQRIWKIMTSDKLPFGSTVTYGELAKLAGSPKGARAVGMANNKNPMPIIIPCHRVMGASGKLTGFRWGIDVKKKLLEIEKL